MGGKNTLRVWILAGLVVAALGPALGAQEAVRCSAEWRVEETTHLCAVDCPEAGAVCHVADCHCAQGEPGLLVHLELRAWLHEEVEGLYWIEMSVRDEQERVVASPRIVLPAAERGIIQSIDRLGESVLFIALEVDAERFAVDYTVTAWPQGGELTAIARGTVAVAKDSPGITAGSPGR